MPYYLKHYFMPDFNHKRLRPVAMADGSTAMHYLGYVQNVVAGQVLAELTPLDGIPEGYAAQDETPGALPKAQDAEARDADASLPIPDKHGYPEQEDFAVTLEDEEKEYWDFLQNLDRLDPRFVYNNPVFPLGPNCGRDPKNPNRIIALANGYCFYHQGLITVKKLLNVRQDVDFHTGNITFVGDIVVHGDVHPGFSVTGSSILIKGRLNGGRIKARGNVVAEAGAKGSPDAVIRAGLTVRIASCERATVITSGNLVIDGNALHGTFYVGGSLLSKERLQGGSTHANGIVYVKEKLGNSQGAPTSVALGYNALDFLRLQEIKNMVQVQEETLDNLKKQSRKGPHFEKECAPSIELALRKLEILERMSKAGWRKLSADSRMAARARVIVPGTVYPGVEISIGRAYHKVIDEQQNVFYSLYEEEIVFGSPAVIKNWSPPSPGAGENAEP